MSNPHDPHDPIAAALAAEERDLLRQIETEPAYFEQIGSLFAGRNNWVNWLLMAAQAMLFIAGLVCAFHFYQAADAHAAIFWGIPGAVLLLMALIIKLAMLPIMQANRVLLALKRLELRLAQQDR